MISETSIKATLLGSKQMFLVKKCVMRGHYSPTLFNSENLLFGHELYQ